MSPSRILHSLWCLLPAVLPATPGLTDLNEGLSISYDSATERIELEWWGRDTYLYFVSFSYNLVDWTFESTHAEGNDAVLSQSLGTTENAIFFQVHFSNDPDSTLLSTDYNGAGVSAWDQIQLGYNPFDTTVDTNANAILDVWEVYHFGALIQPSQEVVDEEPDGLLNTSEYTLGTNPLVADHPDVALHLFTPSR